MVNMIKGIAVWILKAIVISLLARLILGMTLESYDRKRQVDCMTTWSRYWAQSFPEMYDTQRLYARFNCRGEFVDRSDILGDVTHD